MWNCLSNLSPELTYVTHSGVVDFLFDKLLSATVFHLLPKLEWILNLAPKFNKVYWEAPQVNTHFSKRNRKTLSWFLSDLILAGRRYSAKINESELPIVNVAAVLAKHCCNQDIRLVVVPLKKSYLERLGNHKKHLGFPRPDPSWRAFQLIDVVFHCIRKSTPKTHFLQMWTQSTLIGMHLCMAWLPLVLDRWTFFHSFWIYLVKEFECGSGDCMQLAWRCANLRVPSVQPCTAFPSQQCNN